MAKRTKKTAKRGGRKSTASNRGSASESNSSLSALSVAELQLELRRRQREVNKLVRRRDKLAAELAELNAQIADLGGAAGGLTPTGRTRNAMTLPDALYQVLQGRTMSVTDAADAVRAAGYHSTAANFRTMVNQALLKDKRFKKVSRGQYTAS
ncbi:MAG: hypothetical protein D6692_09460 [Planctomycetota bacterium]|nr:MAG: hypothetical protein D6692_09460 [Planctomycetota bacterium]